MDALAAISVRRSVGRLQAPGPEGADLDAILAAGAAAPDHEGLRPWRFVVLSGSAKTSFSEVMAATYTARCRAAGEEPTEGQVSKERQKLGRAPVVVVVAAHLRDHPKVPREEQLASAAAAAQNILLAATALGFGSMWRTGPAAYDSAVKAALGLGEEDAIVGFLYLGTVGDGRRPEPRVPDATGLVTHWRDGSGRRGEAAGAFAPVEGG